MPTLNLWDGLSVRWGDAVDFEHYAGEALPLLETQMTRGFIVAVVLFVAGLVALHFEGLILGAALLLLALHYNQQSNKAHVLLILTAYNRAITRMIGSGATNTD